ncbi:class I SAM-dependent methyltransferase [Thermodesulfobacteriota bacterium]
MNERAEHEIRHGEFLAEGDTELIWGWGTPAGRVRARRRAKLIEIGARLGPDSHVLEIGCGTGMFTEMFVQTGCSIIAVDISADLLKKAEARNLPKEKVHFMQKRFEDCNVDGPFDAVIGSSILHHLELNDALPRIYELLKPNGIMSFAEPNMLNPQVFAERKLRRLFPYISPDETAFVRWTFRRDLQKIGFQNIKTVPFDWLHPSVPKQLIDLVFSTGRVIERVPLLREFSGSLHIRAVRPAK